ncbi:peptidase M23-like protein [Asanoa ferruginea]|uniref:Peptidase M23-like protein n=2 Tax=Asanoa ferruginea TaxID=53367 RepID=A0A3D9ZWI8_9ACTN|nr:M23 family metallopeptidase [Asanoa ferruginea]REG00923.1 peptidase M23-like protein [Asanoa ferruginea]GIF47506.1 hypothetical protein Afe04nite_20450 [Asanoa ferruginea]
MSSRAIAATIAAVVGIVLLCAGGLAAVTGVASACSTVAASSDVSGRYDATQIRNAGVIAIVGDRLHVPVRGQIIAIATALQESQLRNLGHLGPDNDHDSLGLFQQRPSQGWGTPTQLQDPAYAATAFYRKLATIPRWQTMPLTVAAQAVQRSAYPDAYAKWEADAAALHQLTADETNAPSSEPMNGCTAFGGWTMPVDGPIGSGFRTETRPSHDGIDIIAAKGTPVRAAATGTVIRIVCDARLRSGRPYSCDMDGHPTDVMGCGWFVELQHPNSTVTRYCHLVERPNLHEAQQIAGGRIIGHVGSSGHSSGPHLHLETHNGRPATRSNAVDPISVLAIREPDR